MLLFTPETDDEGFLAVPSTYIGTWISLLQLQPSSPDIKRAARNSPFRALVNSIAQDQGI